MVIGDPYKFSICVQTIREWNLDDTFCNGVLLFCIDGALFPNEIITATLKSEIPPLQDSLSHVALNDLIYNMQKDAAFKEMYNLTFPEDMDIDNDYRYFISPSSLADYGCFAFAVTNGTFVRILAAKLNYCVELSQYSLDGIEINETIISATELNQMVNALSNAY